MGKPKAPDGYPVELIFCKGRFVYYRSNDSLTEHIYKLDNLLIIVSEVPNDTNCYVNVYATSKDHNGTELSKSAGPDIQKAVKQAEKEFRATYYKIKSLMEK
jgi:hypothetical protein